MQFSLRVRTIGIVSAALSFSLALGSGQTPKASTSPVPASLPLSGLNGSGEGPITIVAFSDFESFLCARSAAVLKAILGRGGDVQLIFKHAPSKANPNALLAHEASLAAGAQGKFWEMHDLLFENQKRLTSADLLEYAKFLGLNLPAFQKALEQHTYRPFIERDLAEARGLGVTSTPTFFVNGRLLVGPQSAAALQGFVDSVRDSLPANRENTGALTTSNSSPVIHLEHAPVKGPDSAPISLVEFSDFECSYCAQMIPVISKLMASYPTQIRLSFKHYPLSQHKLAPLAHEAAAAAADQGKFWEMHDLIFATSDKLTRADLIAKAKQLNLDVPRFTKDLDSHRFKAAVDYDRQEGDRLGVDGAPFYFVNGHSVSGAVSLTDFKKVIDGALRESASQAR